MLIFNYTKAAADFFSVTRQGKKVSCIVPAPHKTISESIATPVFPDDVDPQENGGSQWQWVVHCVAIKRKKYLLVIDVRSRFCITLLAGKKGDQYEFLNQFDLILKSTFHLLAHERGIDDIQISMYIDSFDNKVNTCAFHARSDRSVQAHLNDALWHLEAHSYQNGMLLEMQDLLKFNLYLGEIPRKTKGSKEYFFPNQEFIRFWETQIQADDSAVHLPENEVQNLNNVVFLSNYRK